MRGIGHVQRLRSRDGYQRPTVHGCRPPCVCESTGAGNTALPDTYVGQALAQWRDTTATLLAASLVRTFSAAHFVRGAAAS